MKCLVLSVVVIAVAFTVNCRDVPGQTEGSNKPQRLVGETALTELDVPAQPQGRTDNSQQLVETDIAAQHKEMAEDHEIEIISRKNKCKENAVCADKGGECIGKKDICSGTIVSGICGKKCECCVVDNIDMKIDTLELQLKSKIDKQTSDIDEIIVNLKGDIEIELQGMGSMIRNMTHLLESIETKLQAPPTTTQSTTQPTTTQSTPPPTTSTAPPSTTTSTAPTTTTQSTTPPTTTSTAPPTTVLNCEALGGVTIAHQCLIFHVGGALNWEQAAARCASNGGHIASLEDPSAVITYKYNTYGGTQFWVGGSDANAGNWAWRNGKSFDDSFPWSQPYEPSDDSGGVGDCLMTWTTTGYNDERCTTRLPGFICDVNSRCEELGGFEIANQCLIFHTEEALSWGEAAARCTSNGAELASLADPSALITYKYNIHGGTNFWLGGSDADAGNWAWRNGKPFDDSFPWSSSEPSDDSRGVGDCLMTWTTTGYNDQGCTTRLPYICEIIV